MAKEVKAKFRKKNGKIKMIASKIWEMEMNNMFPDDCDIIGTFRKSRKMRSTLQNSYYWSCVIPEVIEGLIGAGFESKDINTEVVHDMLRNKFLTTDLPSHEFTGDFITITKSSTELSTGEFIEYISQIQRWAADFLHHIIPDPGQQKEIYY